MSAGAATLPFSWYSDPDILRREQERIFRRSWQYVGHTGQLVRPGDYFTSRAGDVPVVVLLDEEARTRAFVNVCRHRGSEVVHEAGNRRTLQCRYHAWTYRLDGSLCAAPRSEREADFDASSLGLLPVQVETWGPFVFANPDPTAPSLAAVLGDMPERLAAGGTDVSSLRFRLRVAYELEANWKVVIENYLECYHCPVAHPGLTSLLDVDPDAYRLDAGEWFSAQVAPVRDAAVSGADSTGDIAEGRFFFLWPNLRVNVFPGPPNLSLGPALPDGPERTRGFFDYFFPDGAGEDWPRELIEFDQQVGREDRELVESVQRGVSSGLVERGRLLLSGERLIAHFQSLLARALAD
ncbi:MAG: aromatic ring-hydroxylating dioxygenase subunit alpha [Actinomycetota bacterium]|nr:aromatic ring-hydroxylating dioxygenase subunit alpha [Actinomycetota bacterium]